MYLTVYSPRGEPFEVIPSRAKRLVINEGWSFNKEGQIKEGFIISKPPATAMSEIVETMAFPKWLSIGDE